MSFGWGADLPPAVPYSRPIFTSSRDFDYPDGNLGLTGLKLPLEAAGGGSALAKEPFSVQGGVNRCGSLFVSSGGRARGDLECKNDRSSDLHSDSIYRTYGGYFHDSECLVRVAQKSGNAVNQESKRRNDRYTFTGIALEH
jgi:hypothetical protein